jgi:hypothetical protein
MIIDIDDNVIYLEAIFHNKNWFMILKSMANVVYWASDLLLMLPNLSNLKCLESYLN